MNILDKIKVLEQEIDEAKRPIFDAKKFGNFIMSQNTISTVDFPFSESIKRHDAPNRLTQLTGTQSQTSNNQIFDKLKRGMDQVL